MCFPRRDASTDMQHDLFGSLRDIDLWSKFDTGLLMPTCTFFRRVWKRETRWGSIFLYIFLFKSLFAKKTFFNRAPLTFLDLQTFREKNVF